MTTQEQLLKVLVDNLSSARGLGGSKIITGGIVPESATGRIIAIESIGPTYELGVVTGNSENLSERTFDAPFLVYGQFSLVTAGPLSSDMFIVYYAI